MTRTYYSEIRPGKGPRILSSCKAFNSSDVNLSRKFPSNCVDFEGDSSVPACTLLAPHGPHLLLTCAPLVPRDGRRVEGAFSSWFPLALAMKRYQSTGILPLGTPQAESARSRIQDLKPSDQIRDRSKEPGCSFPLMFFPRIK